MICVKFLNTIFRRVNVNNSNITFYKLLSEYEIKIPIIQRDYAQGRPLNENILSDFLKALKKSIDGEPINLDFVYGNIINGVFEPLDGQQRLTTLFLLHWYAFMMENKKEEDKEKENILRKFSYETRISSRRFCDYLVSNKITIDKSCDKISELIYDEKWFFISWKQDPSIRAMLNSIDIIHDLFKEEEKLWDRLVDDDKKLITFHLLILDNFGLSDDLYIKMNARGRLLTPFECLKAELQDKISKENWENPSKNTELFVHKIDTTWTDFLWDNDFRKDNTVDEAHMRFISSLVIAKVALNDNIEREKKLNIIKQLNENYSDRNLIKFIDEDTFKYIKNCYNIYSRMGKDYKKLKIDFDMWNHELKEELILNQILSKDTTSTYTHKVLFFAQNEYLQKNGENINCDNFFDWMRVIRNIVSRSNISNDGTRNDIIRSPETFHGIINLVNELSNGCQDIYTHLSTVTINSSFAKEQVKEEIIKSKIISNDKTQEELKKLIFGIEDNKILRGKIMLPLICAGFNPNKNIDFNYLCEIKNVFEKYFNKRLEKCQNEFDLLRRAMLTIEVEGKYQFYTYWTSYWIAGDSNKHRLFTDFIEIESFINNNNFNKYFIKLIKMLTKNNYEDIINNFKKPNDMPKWQYRLITEKKHLKNCESKYIAIPSDNSCCYMLKSQRPSDTNSSPCIK